MPFINRVNDELDHSTIETGVKIALETLDGTHIAGKVTNIRSGSHTPKHTLVISRYTGGVAYIAIADIQRFVIV